MSNLESHTVSSTNPTDASGASTSPTLPNTSTNPNGPSEASGAAQAPPAPTLNQAQLQRLKEVERINACLAINPFAILKVRSDATSMDVKAAYKSISMMIHPDRCAVDFVERAKLAFAKLNAARDELLDEEKRAHLTELVLEARTALIEEKKEAEAKRKNEELSRSGALAAKITSTEAKDAASTDVTLDPAFDEAVLARVAEKLIEQEWIKRKLLAEHAKQANDAREEQERKRLEAEAQARETKQWEQSRDTRVNDWKSFMNTKRVKMIKPPAHKTEEDSRSAQLRKGTIPDTNTLGNPRSQTF